MEEDTLYDKVTLPYTDVSPKAGNTPFFLVLLLLIFFPPAAWYVMWREKEYHLWFTYLIAFYGVLTLLGSYAIRLIFIPYSNNLYASLGLTQPKVSPFSYTTIYLILGIIEIALAAVLYVVFRKHKDLPRLWLIAGLIGLAFNSFIQPITQGYLTYTAFNNLVQQSHTAQTQSITLTPTIIPTVSDETTGWNTFTSPEETFSFKYPPNMTDSIVKNDTYDFFKRDTPNIKGTTVVFEHPITEKERKSYYDNPPKKVEDFTLFYGNDEKFKSINLRDFVTSIDEGEVRDITIDSSTTAKEYLWGCQTDCVNIVFRKGNSVFNFYEVNYSEQELESLRQVVSTFKFSDQNPKLTK